MVWGTALSGQQQAGLRAELGLECAAGAAGWPEKCWAVASTQRRQCGRSTQFRFWPEHSPASATCRATAGHLRPVEHGPRLCEGNPPISVNSRVSTFASASVPLSSAACSAGVSCRMRWSSASASRAAFFLPLTLRRFALSIPTAFCGARKAGATSGRKAAAAAGSQQRAAPAHLPRPAPPPPLRSPSRPGMRRRRFKARAHAARQPNCASLAPSWLNH